MQKSSSSLWTTRLTNRRINIYKPRFLINKLTKNRDKKWREILRKPKIIKKNIQRELNVTYIENTVQRL